jgi:DNA ligase (NAD+)
VNIGGATVKQATLHNEDYIRSKGLMVGDWVVVERAGEVIPQIVSAITGRRSGGETSFEMPTCCPSCGHQVVRPEGEAMSYCVNRACPAQLVRLLEHFVSKGSMDIEGMGWKLGLALIEGGLVADVADLYFLKEKEEDVLAMDRMADKSVANLLEAIERSKDAGMARVLVALGIDHVGSEVAELLTRRMRSMDVLMAAPTEELTAIPGIGPKIAESVVRYFRDGENLRVVEKLRRGGVRLAEEHQQGPVEQPLDGLRFVVTGRLRSFSRSQIEDKIKELGGVVTGSVSRRTSYLVAGEDAGSKLADAQRLGVQVATEEELLGLIVQGQA